MKKQHYHFIGIGGIGMGALASLMLEKGFQVSGSDIKDSPMTASLKKAGAVIYIGHQKENINGAECIIYSSAIQEDNPEWAEARRKGLPILQRAKLLANLMTEHESITVAGAHGKTTTTSMTANLLIKAGLNPTTAVGGMIAGTNSNARLGTGKYFVSEVDESDGSFLYFTPKYSIITNIDKEHLDYYKNWESILNAYSEFVGRTQDNGMLFICSEDEHLLSIIKKSGKKFQTYGFSSDNHVAADNIDFCDFSSRYDCVVNGKKLGTIELKVPGRHNVLNSLGCMALGLHLGMPFSTIQSSLAEYREVKRRFQLLADFKGIRVVDDYAHHPTEIRATLDAASRIKKQRLIAVFQPHRYTRFKSLYQDFAESLKNVDHLVVTDVYAASEKPIAGISAENFVRIVKDISKNQIVYVPKDGIINYLKKLVAEGDLILMLGAGDITKIAHDFSDWLKNSQDLPVGKH